MTTPTLHPKCIWYEDQERISITLDHPDLRITDLVVYEDRVVLRHAVCNGTPYAMELELFGKVEPTYMMSQGSRNCPCIVLTKAPAPPADAADADAEEPPLAEAAAAAEACEMEKSAEDPESDLDDLSSLSSESEWSEDGAPCAVAWKQLLKAGVQNRFVSCDWARWSTCEVGSTVSDDGTMSMAALQAMLQKQQA